MDEDDEDDEYYNYDIEGIKEINCVGAGIGGGYQHSDELKTMNYKEAMATDEKEEWIKEKDKEHDRMKKYKV